MVILWPAVARKIYVSKQAVRPRYPLKDDVHSRVDHGGRCVITTSGLRQRVHKWLDARGSVERDYDWI